MWDNAVWGLFGAALASFYTMLSLPAESQWNTPLLVAGIILCVLSVMVLCWPLRDAEQRAVVWANIKHPIRTANELVDPSHVIIVGLLIVMAGIIWQWRQPSRLQNRITELEQQLAPVVATPAIAPSPPVEKPKPPRIGKDAERFNEALAQIHGLIETKLKVSINRFTGLVPSFPANFSFDNYASALAALKQGLSSIEADEKDIDDVSKQKEFSYLRNDIRSIVTPSGFYVPGAERDLQREIRDFLDMLEIFSKRFPQPNDEITYVLTAQGQRLRPQLFSYAEWARQTVEKIEAERKK
jgi:hypothetical protein